MSHSQNEWVKQNMQELQRTLASLQERMLQFQKKTDYINAQIYRKYHEDCKNYILQRNLKETENRHKNEINDNNNSRMAELTGCKGYWDDKMKQYDHQYRNLLKQLQIKYQQEADTLRSQMQRQLSLVVKESHQLINLRKMQQYASRQKNFVEAHSIQQKVSKMYEIQKNLWMEGREKTIVQALKNLRNRQDQQIGGINRKYKLAMEDFAKDKYLGEQSINQKYDKLLKQLKARHQREVLSLHGQLRNTGGKSPMKKGKGSFLNDKGMSLSEV